MSGAVTKLSALCAIAIWSVSGCASAPKTPEERVVERAKQRWEAALAGDFERVYSMTAPSYRGLVDYKRFLAKRGTASTLTGAEVVKATCEPKVCVVVTRLEAVALVPGVRDKLSTGFEEKWVFEDGDWWLHE